MAIRALIRSHNARGQVTLTQNVATTTISNENIKAGAIVHLTPASAAAAAELAVWPGTATDGAVVINHPNNATAGRVWNYIAQGG